MQEQATSNLAGDLKRDLEAHMAQRFQDGINAVDPLAGNLGPSPMADQLSNQQPFLWTSPTNMLYADYWQRGYSTDKRRACQKIPIPLSAIAKVQPKFLK